jgi:DegV family protein with EDD domain
MIRIITDSTASIPKAIAQENDIEVVSMYINRDGAEYEDATMDVDAFYDDIYDMVDNIPKSSQPSQAVLEEAFERAAEAGDDAVGIFMSSLMSGTVNGALHAARSVAARHADFRFRVIDSMSNSFDEAWSVLAAAAARKAGCTLDQCCEAATRSIAASRFLFTPESLRFLKAGGRIGNGAALLGTIMKLCPIFTVTDGVTTTFAKVRTHKRAVAAIVDKFKSDIDEYGLRSVIVHYIGSPDEAKRWAREVIEPLCGRKVDVVPVSPVIGLHVGPAIGIAYECDKALPGRLASVNPSALVYSS